MPDEIAYAFDTFYKDVMAQQTQPKVTLDIANSPNWNKEAFARAMLSLDNYTPSQIIDLISDNLDYINADVMANDVTAYEDAFLNQVFPKALGYIFTYKPEKLTYSNKIMCNKIVYDYMTITDGRKNEYTKKAYIHLSKIVNAPTIAQLKAIGLLENMSCNLALSRFSSYSERTNILRVNFVICKCDRRLMTEQMIVWVYEKLFDHIGILFTTSMLEVYTDEEEDDLGEDFSETYSTITLALLTIVNNMPINDIETIIKSFLTEWNSHGRGMTRCSLRALSGDFSRINIVIDNLIASGVSVP
jgi:hypothetical protein